MRWDVHPIDWGSVQLTIVNSKTNQGVQNFNASVLQRIKDK